MKIVHICLSGAVTDGFAYQDNLLSKYHKNMGYDVSFITSKWIYNDNGEIEKTDKGTYFNEDGIKMIRLQNKKGEKYEQKLKHYIGLTKALNQERPDILFIHGPQFLEMPEIVQFVKKNQVDVYVDNHADFSNSGRTFLSKFVLQGMIWKHMAHIINPYTKKFYGVLPARVNWLKNVYGLPDEKCELLVMGADDEAVQQALSEQSQQSFRKKYGIKQDDFLIVTGGKIDSFKLQTLLLMKAVCNIQNDRLKLVIFGSVQKDIKPRLEELCDGNKVQYIGWAKGDQSYEFMGAADLVVFPGRHSVYWEQAAGLGIPMLCKYWDGTTHVDCGGNVQFLYEDSVDEIVEKLKGIIDTPDNYKRMLAVAQSEARYQFSYKEIAKKSIGM